MFFLREQYATDANTKTPRDESREEEDTPMQIKTRKLHSGVTSKGTETSGLSREKEVAVVTS